MEKDELYYNLCGRVDKLLLKYNPCKIIDRKCLRGHFCCHECTYLIHDQCSVNSLACKLWLCDYVCADACNSWKL
jgi:hypothetical protein